MTDQQQTVSDTLDAAADLIERRGWVVGVGGWPDMDAHVGGLCLEGALQAAMGLDSHYDALLEDCAAYQAVRAHLSDRCTNEVLDPGVPHPHLWAWNDTVAQSAAEVVEVLRATAVIEAARESEAAQVSA